jgi:hypothetical protein
MKGTSSTEALLSMKDYVVLDYGKVRGLKAVVWRTYVVLPYHCSRTSFSGSVNINDSTTVRRIHAIAYTNF